MSFARRIARSERQNYIYQSRSQKFASIREAASVSGSAPAATIPGVPSSRVITASPSIKNDDDLMPPRHAGVAT